jgi:hypothetical protein
MRPTDRVVVVGFRPAKSPILLIRNSGVSSLLIPLSTATSLKQPFGVPSAKAPLSPKM